MVLGDFEKLKEVCTSWGIQDSEMFASMQLFKPFRKHHNGSTHFRKTSRTVTSSFRHPCPRIDCVAS